MFNECLIHLCDYAWLNVLHMLNHMLIKHKNIFVYFYLFLESILFWKVQKSKNCVQLCFGESVPQSWKRLRKFFKNSRFLGFSRLILVTCLQVELQSQANLEGFMGSPRDLLASGLPSSEKHLNKFSKICVMGYWRLARDSF